MSSFCLRKEGQQNICFFHAKSAYFVKIRRHYCISLDIYTATLLITSMFVKHSHMSRTPGLPSTVRDQRRFNATDTAHRSSTNGEKVCCLLYQITCIKCAAYFVGMLNFSTSSHPCMRRPMVGY